MKLRFKGKTLSPAAFFGAVLGSLAAASASISCSGSAPHVFVKKGGDSTKGTISKIGGSAEGILSTKKSILYSPPAGTLPNKETDAVTGVMLGPSQPADVRTWRLTRDQYNNTVRDLFAVQSNPADKFVAEEQVFGFNNNADTLRVSQIYFEQVRKSAESIASNFATTPRLILVDCPEGTDDNACVLSSLQKVGLRVFRRPLIKQELDDLFALYKSGRAGSTPNVGVQLVVEAMLQSPSFLYRLEVGGLNADKPSGVVSLDSYEIASQLSYLLWDSMPDAPLFAAAAINKLVIPAEVAQQARRMLSDPRAVTKSEKFFRQWFGISNLESKEKNKSVFPEYTAELAKDFLIETDKFVNYVVWEKNDSIASLFSSPFTFSNRRVSNIYGDVSGSEMQFDRLELDPMQRAGVMTHGSILASHSGDRDSFPIHRGKFVWTNLLCRSLPPPPPSLQVNAPKEDPKLTTRERFAQHSKDPACSSCHQLLDGAGFGFENYDGIGRFRLMEAGKPVSGAGKIVTSLDADGPFDGAVELSHRLSSSKQLHGCAATQAFRYFMGRIESPGDQRTLSGVTQSFFDSGLKYRELLFAITQADTFYVRKK